MHVVLTVLLLVVSSVSVCEAQANLQDTPQRRRPVEAALIGDTGRLCVVNRQSGSITLIDTETLGIIGEQRIGQRLSDIAALDGGRLLIADEAAHELLVVDVANGAINVRQRIEVSRSPIQIAVSDDQSTIAVAGLWSQRVTLLSMPAPSSAAEVAASQPPTANDVLTELARVRLTFSPRRMTFVQEDQRLVVVDAFGGEIAVVDVQNKRVESVRGLPAQNIRGLAMSANGERLLLSQQILSPLARADFDDIHWGNLLQNVIREITLTSLFDPEGDLLSGSRVVPLGGVGTGAADPAGIVVMPELDGWIACLAGTGEVAIRTRSGGGRVAVDTQPTSVLWDSEGGVAYVLCTLDDAVVVVDPLKQAVVERISLGPQPEPTPADRGERLFVDGRRSHDGWISCQSCHPDGHTTGGLADTRSDNSFTTPKRILSLLGTRDNNPWAWNGQFRELHEQVSSSFTSTLQGEPLPAPQVNDVVAYLHTLKPPPPVEAGEWTDTDIAQIEQGRALFGSLGCSRCHVPSQTFTIDQTFDVGLNDEAGLTKFNPPSLRGLSHRRRYFHDNRLASLDEVFGEYGHQLGRRLTDDERDALVRFLRSL